MDLSYLLSRGMQKEFLDLHGNLLLELHNLVQSEMYFDAHALLNSRSDIDKKNVQLVRQAFTTYLLMEREREWTSHGIWKTFRFWTDQEKINYLNNTNLIVESLKKISPFVTYGFGSVLGFIRENNFIPHDDDMDLLIAIPLQESCSFEDVKRKLISHLSNEGFTCYNEHKTHFTTNGADVFVGFIENDQSVSWFPSKRKAGLKIENVFPAITKNILGVDISLPKEPEKYLEITYGMEWRSPDSSWLHPWDFSEYSEYSI